MSLLLLVLGALAVGGPLLAQQAEERLDYLNERLRIPESERYSEESYIESGVGLTFGVDRRLSYYPGNYTEATAQFEAAVKRFRYKAEIWVFLSRAYFFMKAPESARDALFRAAEVMPDLSERLWGPLTRGLEWEIRQRANAQRVQADYYSTDQGGFLSLFRLYRFLADTAGAAEVVRSADRRALQMHQGAGMVSAASREAQLAEAARWSDLADSLRLELAAMGGQADLQGAEAVSESLDPGEGPDPVPERLRILQLKSEYYRAAPADYRELFEAYLASDLRDRAAGLIGGVEREIGRLTIQASVAPNVQAEAEYEDRIAEYTQMRREFRDLLGLGQESAP